MPVVDQYAADFTEPLRLWPVGFGTPSAFSVLAIFSRPLPSAQRVKMRRTLGLCRVDLASPRLRLALRPVAEDAVVRDFAARRLRALLFSGAVGRRLGLVCGE